ncbi:MAG: hypothetical protein Q9170_005653, partial [Blastenia crenularia]
MATLTMTATSHPRSTNFSIPTTQNTAPVLSFDCLYTHDLRRKAKRWQDGVLKFHTFNKRIMVYDKPMNYIGDTHWRESQNLQEGDELELERGVLIQVGEEVGRTETDLTELLQKNKRPKPIVDEDDRTSQDGLRVDRTPKRSAESSTTVPFAQLRPKTLNALLGKPRGPVGRAALPTKSPAAIRQETENEVVVEARSPKRRRLQYPTHSSPINPCARSRPIQLDLVPAERDIVTAPAVKATNSVSRRSGAFWESTSPNPEPSNARDVDDLRRLSNKQDKGDSRRSGPPSREYQHHSKPPRRTASPERRAQKAGRADRSVPASASPRNTSYAEVITKHPKAPSGTLRHRNQSDGAHVEIHESNSVSAIEEPRPEHLLRITAKKPRKKLMYRDLLPQKVPPHEDFQRSNSRPATSLPAPSNMRANDTIDDFHDAQRSRLQSRLTRRTTSAETPLAEAHPDQNRHHKMPSAPVYKAPPDRNHSSRPPESLFLAPFPQAESIPEPAHSPKLSLPNSKSASPRATRTFPKNNAPLPQHPHNHTTAPQAIPISKEIIRSALPPQQQQRPFQRSVSDLAPRPPSNNHIIPRTKSALQKALSDTTPHPAPIRTSVLYRSDSDTAASVAQEQPADPW